MSCCKKHKELTCVTIELKSSEESQVDDIHKKVNYDFPTEDTVPLSNLESLRHSKEVKNCLKNEYVRDIMTHILKSDNPTETLAQAMTDPAFVELADACLKVVEGSDEEKPC